MPEAVKGGYPGSYDKGRREIYKRQSLYRTMSVRIDKQDDQAKCLYRTMSVRTDKQDDQAKCLYRTMSVRTDKQDDQAKC